MSAGNEADHQEADCQQVRGAIAMVANGFAVGVMLCGLQAPEAAAAALVATAAAAGVKLRVERDASGHACVKVGSH